MISSTAGFARKNLSLERKTSSVLLQVYEKQNRNNNLWKLKLHSRCECQFTAEFKSFFTLKY